ncbi:transcriptional regulator [Carnobacteriaceae bacterium zg-ZUI240]|nr:transcriptional regulator [Carnobacteriaceae bacterium zg-ZUI240]
MSLIPNLNEKETKEKAKEVLLGYNALKRIANVCFETKLTASYSFQPRSQTNDYQNPIEKHVIRQQTALQILEKIELAINKIPTLNHRAILIEKYCKGNTKDDYVINRLRYSDSDFYRELDKALLWFAESYNNGEILVFNEQSYYGGLF